MCEPPSPHRPTVGIGASAGGIEAFRSFFEHMPADSGLSFVVVLHLSPDRTSNLPEILARWTAMPVVEVTEGCKLSANHVYVPPPGVMIILRAGRLHLLPAASEGERHPIPISMFFDSLATELGEDAIGIVLSGTGSDGALGLKAIKSRGGLTLAQQSHGGTPHYDGMPASAVATGAVDVVAPVEEMPARIIAVEEARRRRGRPLEVADPDEIEQARLAICVVLNQRLGHDFSGYKDKTFLRRVQRRMQVLRLATFGAYVAHIEQQRGEATLLFRDLLIGVTSFFRDADTFLELKQTILPRLFGGKTAQDTIRVWVPGCATGEEAYSLGMLMREHLLDAATDVPKVQIFASDIDEAAIATARAGRYPSTLVQGLSAERLSRFFSVGADGSHIIAKEIRELCTFSTHSLTRDPPFSRIDLVSCRNLLIYLDTDLQATVLPSFHYSLVRGGILLLGSSETVARSDDLFLPLDRARRIFLRRDVASPPLALSGRSAPRSGQGAAQHERTLGVTRTPGQNIGRSGNQRVLERYAPPFVVVHADGDVVQYSSRIGRFLEPAAGVPSQNLFEMARAGLRFHLLATLRQAVEAKRPVQRQGVPVQMAGGEGMRVISIAAEPLPDAGETLYLIVFLEAREEPASLVGTEGMADQPAAEQHIIAELRDTREQLQSITEEHETVLEELRCANEELQSVNEEFQSTNEELETSKEEIQSINEELQTVNSQLAAKVEELNMRNTDLQNLFESTQVATVFVDPYLVIRGFTPAMAGIYNLIPSDQGRQLTDIVSRLRYTSLRPDVQRVLTTLDALEQRVAREDDTAHYLMRIQPYRTPDSAVDGAVITFVNVTGLVRAEEHQRLLVDELNHRVKNMLTVVISMATQTIRGSGTMEQFATDYLGRIHALSAAYSLLSSEGWRTVSLQDILLEELKPFSNAKRGNVAVRGPHVLLSPQSALALGMAIHELTTNAVKYGALSVPEGHVDVAWRLEAADGGKLLVLDWLEKEGPTVVPPTRRGFGTSLIERSLTSEMSAKVELRFPPSGVSARICAPLSAILATPDKDIKDAV